jgi:hypothetical protein
MEVNVKAINAVSGSSAILFYSARVINYQKKSPALSAGTLILPHTKTAFI